MEKRTSTIIQKKELVVTFIIFLVFVTAVFVRILPITSFAYNPLFRGYLTLLVKSDAKLDEFVHTMCHCRNVEAVISYETAPVSFTSFNSRESVPLREVDYRFDVQDPRFDAYMNKIKAYFIHEYNEEEWRTLYVKTTQSAVDFYHQLAALFEHSGIEWQLYEYNAQQHIAVFVVFNLLYIIFLLFFHKATSYKLLMLCGILPWIYTIPLANLNFFMFYIAISFYWALFVIAFIPVCENRIFYRFQDRDTKNLHVHGLLLGLILVVYLFMVMYSNGQVWDVFLSTAFWAVIISGYAGMLIAKKKVIKLLGNSHTLFRPISIVRGFSRRWNWEGGRSFVFVAGICFFTISPLLFFSLHHHVYIPVPTPVYTQEREINLEAMRDMGLNRGKDILPDLADYIVHIAYQERLEYGGSEFRFPDKDEKIMMSTYERNADDNKIQKTSNVIRIFDDRWFDQVIAEIPDYSLEKMLFDQGGLVRVRLEKPQLLHFEAGYVWTIFFIWCIFLCPLFLLRYLITPQKLYRVKMYIVQRNKECECKS